MAADVITATILTTIITLVASFVYLLVSSTFQINAVIVLDE